MFLASHVGSGAWSAIGYANRIYQFPVGILVTAFLVPLFPVFSSLVGKGEIDEVRNYFNRGIGALNFIAFPMFVAIILLAYDAVFLVFQRGEFTSEATQMVALALIYLSFGIIPYVFRDCITRIYYAFNDSKTPFLVATSSILLKFLLNYVLICKMNFGIGGITLSTTLVTLVNASLLGFMLRKKMDMKFGIYFKNLFKTAAAAALTYVICLFVYKLVPLDYANWLAVAIKTGVMLILSCVIYVIFAFLFKVEFMKEVAVRIHDTIRRK